MTGESQASFDTRASLLVRVRDGGDVRAWATFEDTYTPLIYGYCRRRGLQHADAADVTQEVMGRVASAMPRFEYDRESGRFRDWLGTITRNELIRWTKRQQSAKRASGGERLHPALEELSDSAGDALWEEQFYGRILEVGLQRIRPEFAEMTWKAFEASWLQSKSASETAELLQIPIDRVYVAKSRVLKRLKLEVELLSHDEIHHV